jgi:hypothetical protein
MGKIAVTLLAACGIALGAAAMASAAEVRDYKEACTADVRWELTLSWLGPSSADLTFTNVQCNTRTTVESGDGEVASTNGQFAYMAPDRLALDGVLGGGAFIATAHGGLPNGREGIVSVAGGSLGASLHGVSLLQPAIAVNEEFVPAGTCGPNCFETRLVRIATNDAGST